MNKIENELNLYRGKHFQGEWPTIYQMFEIALSRFPGRNCLTVFEPKRKSYNYQEVDLMIKRLATQLSKDGVSAGDKVVKTTLVRLLSQLTTRCMLTGCAALQPSLTVSI